jgi:hypothetical protein
MGFGSRMFPNDKPKQPHFGFFIATFEKADVRATPDGLAVFAMEGCKDIDLGNPSNMPGHRNVLDALWNAVRNGQPCAQNAQWGKATLEVVLAVLASAREQREIIMQYQMHHGFTVAQRDIDQHLRTSKMREEELKGAVDVAT